MSEKPLNLRCLNDLPMGGSGVIAELGHNEALVSRMTAVGLAPGRTVQMMRRARFGNTLQVRVGNTLIALRAGEAKQVRLESTTG